MINDTKYVKNIVLRIALALMLLGSVIGAPLLILTSLPDHTHGLYKERF